MDEKTEIKFIIYFLSAINIKVRKLLVSGSGNANALFNNLNLREFIKSLFCFKFTFYKMILDLN